MRTVYILLLVCCSLSAAAQTYTVKGALRDTAGQPVSFATVTLLNPADSTLRHYAISDASGSFQVKGVAKDTFLLQVGALDFQVLYKKIFVNAEKDLGIMELKNKSTVLEEVTVSSERIPFLLKGDTVEYNAGAYKVKPDAVVEDLLKQLPGVEVDRNGKIKTQGKEVNKVLVDGKEFFGNDPKLTTKNLPADAVKKVQVFDKKSDAALFTGIDDGERDKTINLELKDEKRKGYFGNLAAGGGMDDRYQLNAKLYQFRKDKQLAVLGMANNINEFGFTLDDYINFQGIGNFMNGGNVQIRFNRADDMPVNFGQTINGLIHSGAAGANYTWQPGNNRRFNISYLANGADKDLVEETDSRNFTQGSEFDRLDRNKEHSRSFAHRLSLSGRYDPDSSTLVSLNGGASIRNNNVTSSRLTSSFTQDILINSLQSWQDQAGSALNANGRFSLSRRSKGKIPVWRLDGTINYDHSLAENDWRNIFTLPGTNLQDNRQFMDDGEKSLAATANTAVVYSAGKGFYIETSLGGGYDIHAVNRRQGTNTGEDIAIDSLSPDFSRTVKNIRPGISLQQNKKNRNLRMDLAIETGILSSQLNGTSLSTQNYALLLPSLMWRKEFGRGKSLNIDYDASVNYPTASQMLPTVNTGNPLQVFYGNPHLLPEYQHQLSFHGLKFDEFNMSSMFFNLTGRYINNKINWSRSIQPDLTQYATMVNVPDDYMLSARAEYSAPIRKLGVNITGSVGERYQQGINLVNSVANKVTLITHEAELRINNRKKTKWDAQAGARINYTDAAYSIQQELDNSFYTLGYFAELSWRPNDNWYFLASADVSSYRSGSFEGTVNIPLVKAEASYFFLKYKRGSITVNAFDLLNANKGIQRMSELNYLAEQRSNIIGQYFMLSFKYRLSKAGDRGGGQVIRIGR